MTEKVEVANMTLEEVEELLKVKRAEHKAKSNAEIDKQVAVIEAEMKPHQDKIDELKAKIREIRPRRGGGRRAGSASISKDAFSDAFNAYLDDNPAKSFEISTVAERLAAKFPDESPSHTYMKQRVAKHVKGLVEAGTLSATKQGGRLVTYAQVTETEVATA